MLLNDKFRRLALGLAISTVVAVGIYWQRLLASADELRASVLQQSSVSVTRLTAAASTQTEALVRHLDSTIIQLRADFIAHPREIDKSLQAVVAGLPDNAVPQIGIIDADGILIASSLGISDKIYLGDREHFRVHAEAGAPDRLFISTPVLGRRSNTWSIQLTRRIEQNGRFRGVIVASVSPEYLARQFTKLDLGQNDTIAVFQQDGVYLSRIPNLLEYMGKAVPANRPFVGPTASGHGTFRSRAAHEPINRIYAWQRLGDLPLVVAAGLAEDDFFAPVEREIQRNLVRNGIGTGLVIFLAATISLLLLRLGKQQEKALSAANLYRSLFEKNTSVKLLIDPDDGRIVDANSAACSFYGHDRPHLLGKSISDLNALSPAQIHEEMDLARSEGRKYFNFQHRLASGEIREVEVYSGPVSIDGKTLLHSIIHDVTDRRRLEQRLQASEARFRTLFEILPEGILLVGPDGKINAANDAALAILGTSREKLDSRPYQLLYPDGQPVPLEDYPSRRCIKDGTALNQVLFGIETGSGAHWISVCSRAMPEDEGAKPSGVAISITDVTRLLELEESLRISQSVFETTTEGILVTDANAVITSVNPAFSAITGYSPRDVLGHKPGILSSGLHDRSFYRKMYDSLSAHGSWEGEITNRRKDGSFYVESLKISAVRDREGRVARYVGLLSDITDKKRKEEEIWHRANYDALTDLPNRILFQDRLQQAIAQVSRHRGRVAALFIDLDRFKAVNDTYGHPAGDELLQQVSLRIRNCLRDEDTVARVGGDEFVVLLPNIQEQEIPYTVAEKILTVLNQPFMLQVAGVEISASIGVALFPDHADSASALLARADVAMYQAKTAGRGTIRNASAKPEGDGAHGRICDQPPL